MNIRFIEIQIENFRSIANAVISLENQGTVIVRGVNDYEDNATSNGSGKSSIFEAIIYALFEETSAGEKDVANRINHNGFCLNLKLQIDGIDYTIVRESSKSNKSTVILYKNDVDISARNKTDTNKQIIDLLGINKNVFLDSVFLSQNATTNLASLSPTQRKERLEILTNTDNIISNFKEQLKQKQATFESKCVELQLQINKLEGNKESVLQQQLNIQQQIQNIHKQIEQRNAIGNINDLEKQIQELNKQIEIKNKQIPDIDTQIQDITTEIQSMKQQQEQLNNSRIMKDEQVQNQRLLCTNMQAEIEKLEMVDKLNCNVRIDNLEKDIDNIKNSDRCPTCGRRYENIDEQHIQNVIDEKMEQIEEQKTKISDITETINEKQRYLTTEIDKGVLLKSEFDDIVNNYNEITTQINKKQSNISDLSSDKTNLLNNIQLLQNQISNINNKKEQILKIEIPDIKQYETMLQDSQNQLKDIEQQQSDKDKILQEYNDYVGSIKHSLQLVTKEFRTYLLQNSIIYLNNLLQTYSRQLFSNDKDIIHITQDDTKLNIQLGDATYESLSGGEKTRVNIALLLAQKSLASTIGNISCNIIILDEILGYCDSHAEENVISLITSELDSLESIYMISHKEIPIGYDTEIIVTKNKQGLSTVRCY